jgi:hypothetical protein
MKYKPDMNQIEVVTLYDALLAFAAYIAVIVFAVIVALVQIIMARRKFAKTALLQQ